MHRLPSRSGPRPSARRFLAGLVLLLAMVSFAGKRACAATFTVNSLLDTTDGACAASAGGCTLREAIERVVATPGRDTIRFDPAVFPPRGFDGLITLTDPLPVIADPAGTVIDGAGATVRINGAGHKRGLLFASAPGALLQKVTVANLVVLNFGDAIEVCGGVPPDCLEDVSGVLVRNVAAETVDSGIVVRGVLVSKVRVVGAAVADTGTTGIRIDAVSVLSGARVEGSAVRNSGAAGIVLLGGDRVVGAVVLDSLASRSPFGVLVQGREIVGTKIADVVTSFNTIAGVSILADGAAEGTTITNTVASGFGSTGVELASNTGNRALTVRGVHTDGGAMARGIGVSGPVDGAKLDDLVLTRTAIGLDLADLASTGVTNAKVTNVMSVNNETGVFLIGGPNVLKNVHASANAASGILLSGAGGNLVEKNRAMANGSSGIGLESSANVIQKNVALGNKIDLSDDSSTCSTNIWQKNVFRAGSAPCVQ